MMRSSACADSRIVAKVRWLMLISGATTLVAVSVVLGEAWLFGSTALLVYAAVMAITVHLFVVGYEEPTLRRRFGTSYAAYAQSVSRWVPRRPRPDR